MGHTASAGERVYEINLLQNRHGRWQATVTWSTDVQSGVLPKQKTHKTDEYRYRSYVFFEIDALITKIEEKEEAEHEQESG